ncbi:MAG: fructosamine kinase family protein [Gemmatimonadota bacterium]
MTIPPDLRAAVEEELGRISRVAPVGGGSISEACRIDLDEKTAFLKFERAAPRGFFTVESEGLKLLGAVSSGLRVPEVLACEEAESWSWLALEWLETGPGSGDHGGKLGAALARLHQERRNAFGWERDGFIGSLAQDNAPMQSWPGFWLERRLLPQLELAWSRGELPRREEWHRLMQALPDSLATGDEEGPSLLHGDLWSGNVVVTPDGPGVVDPACYWGHREVDLAMTELFGGFDGAFYSAYSQAWPLRPGYEHRKRVYQLYYLLVHVNLFGAGYVSRTHETLRLALTAV